jgi:glycyl-tRNA synthetase alpha subunit
MLRGIKLKYNLKTKATFILFLILFILTSCTQTETSDMQLEDKEQKVEYEELLFSFEHPQTKQKYKIVHVNPLFQRYIEKVKENPRHLTLELYKEEII